MFLLGYFKILSYYAGPCIYIASFILKNYFSFIKQLYKVLTTYNAVI